MLVQCVPNFSEGRDPQVIATLCEAARSVPGAALLDVHSDPDHNRTVLTVAGHAPAVEEAVFRAVRVAVERIDMNAHDGVHPRLGAADVIPFVPLRGATLSDCAEMAERFARRCAEAWALPCYLYAAAARRPERVRLPWLRRPGYEGLADALASPERAPDEGPPRPHPTAGATAVGARGVLVAFNVDLASEDLRLARRIARAIRESSGGLPGVQAKGLPLARQQRVQVSTNLLAPHAIGPGRIYREVEERARAAGVAVARSELVGLVPRSLAVAAADDLLRSDPLFGERLLEDRLEAEVLDPEGPLRLLAERVAGNDALDPGGGSAVAAGLVLARACLRKALALSRDGRGDLSEQELAALEKGLPPTHELFELVAADHMAFARLMSAFRLPRGPLRKAALQETRPEAVRVPLRILEAAVRIAEAAAVVAERGNSNLVNDAVAAAELALAAGRVARLNARANQRSRERKGYREPLERLERATERARAAAG